MNLKRFIQEIPLKSKRAEPCGSTRFDYAPQGTLCSVKPKRLSLSLDLLQVSEARQTGYLRANVLAVDERQSVVNELLRYAVAFLVDPLTRNLLLGVGNLGQREKLDLALVAVLVTGALEARHVVGLACNCVLNSSLAGHIGLVNVGLGSAVSSAALQQAQLDAGKAMMSDDQIAQAQGQIDAAYAALDEAKNTLDQSEAQIKENEEELTKQEETYESSKAEAKQKLDDAWKEMVKKSLMISRCLHGR